MMMMMVFSAMMMMMMMMMMIVKISGMLLMMTIQTLFLTVGNFCLIIIPYEYIYVQAHTIPFANYIL